MGSASRGEQGKKDAHPAVPEDGQGNPAGMPYARRARGVITEGMGRPIRILGIDPGLRRTGWGVIEVEGNRLVYVACGSAESDEGDALAHRLVSLSRRAGARRRRIPPGRGRGRADLRQQERRRDPQARPGARRRADGAGEGRRDHRRIRAEPRQEDDRRRRPRRQGADPHDARRAAAQGRSADPRRRRRAGDRHHPCPSPPERSRCEAALR